MPYNVVCKLPLGIVVGGVVIRGTAYERDPKKPPPERVYGYALTEDVPEQPWEQWMIDNQRSIMVQNGLIFGSKDLMEARRFARDHIGVSAGMSGGAPAI
jgi:hypothetical protein